MTICFLNNGNGPGKITDDVDYMVNAFLTLSNLDDGLSAHLKQVRFILIHEESNQRLTETFMTFLYQEKHGSVGLIKIFCQ